MPDCLAALLPYCLTELLYCTSPTSPLTPKSKSLGSLDLRFHPPSTSTGALGVSFLGYPIVPLVSCRPLLPAFPVWDLYLPFPTVYPVPSTALPGCCCYTHAHLGIVADRLHLLPRTCLPLAPPPSSHTISNNPTARRASYTLVQACRKDNLHRHDHVIPRQHRILTFDHHRLFTGECAHAWLSSRSWPILSISTWMRPVISKTFRNWLLN